MDEIRMISFGDPSYPAMLATIHDPPKQLFVRGELGRTTDALCLAIVGPRAQSMYGKQIVEMFVPTLSAAGLTIVSGLALGVDGAAHAATLTAGGRTIAVLGSGIDDAHLYPPSHRSLADRIVASGGAVISEYPPGTRSTNFTFPQRNRIVAGMSAGTLVVEAGAGSGALITAACAINENREVFAVPQNITAPTAYGVNELIKSGAHPVTSAEDILEILRIDRKSASLAARASIAASPAESMVAAHLSAEPVHIDAIIKQTKCDSAHIMSTLTIMEMKGMVRNLGGMMYIRA